MNPNPLSDLKTVLGAGGLHAGLTFPNQRVPHRFTAVYGLDALMLRGLDMADKEGLDDMKLEAVPLGDSFCQFTMRDGRFLTASSAADKRLEGHPCQRVVGKLYRPAADRRRRPALRHLLP